MATMGLPALIGSWRDALETSLPGLFEGGLRQAIGRLAPDMRSLLNVYRADFMQQLAALRVTPRQAYNYARENRLSYKAEKWYDDYSKYYYPERIEDIVREGGPDAVLGREHFRDQDIRMPETEWTSPGNYRYEVVVEVEGISGATRTFRYHVEGNAPMSVSDILAQHDRAFAQYINQSPRFLERELGEDVGSWNVQVRRAWHKRGAQW